MISKRLILRLLIVSLFFISCKKNEGDDGYEDNSEVSFVKNRGVLKVVTLKDPIHFFLNKGTPQGFHYALSRAYAKYLGVELEILVARNELEALSLLKQGYCDLVAVSLKSEVNNPKVFFTKPFFTSFPVLVQNKKDKEQYVEDWLSQDKISLGLLQGGAMEQVADNVEKTLGMELDKIQHTGFSQVEMINMVVDGELPATFTDRNIARVTSSHCTNLDVNTRVGITYNVSWAVSSKSESMRESINEWLEGFIKTREYKRLLIKYFKNRKSIANNYKEYLASLHHLSKYDDVIKKEAKILGWDWRLLASVIFVESRFDPHRKSPAGAFGLMQLMPITAKHHGMSVDASIEEQVACGRKLFEFLRVELAKKMKDTVDIKNFMLAGYNSGMGHVLDARRLAHKESLSRDSWQNISQMLPKLSRSEVYSSPEVRHGRFPGKGTVEYVEKIRHTFMCYKQLIP